MDTKSQTRLHVYTYKCGTVISQNACLLLAALSDCTEVHLLLYNEME